jgi:hypothetical protein
MGPSVTCGRVDLMQGQADRDTICGGCVETRDEALVSRKMIEEKQKRRYLLAGSGVVLLGAALLAGYWRHYKLGPRRHLSDPDWLDAHSGTARWEEEQNDYRRTRSSPDVCFRGDRIGYYGGKDWFLWLEEQIRNPDFRHCGCTDYALALMANQQPPSWKEWTDANRARSQEEWIRDGFLKCGVTVHLPPG